jgi:hypothetical protein
MQIAIARNGGAVVRGRLMRSMQVEVRVGSTVFARSAWTVDVERCCVSVRKRRTWPVHC